MKTNKSNKVIIKRKLFKNKTKRNYKHSTIIIEFLETLNTIKLYHWKTATYPTHDATNELQQKLIEIIDQFVKVLVEKNGKRISILDHHLKLYDLNSQKDFTNKMFEFRQLLVEFERSFDPINDFDLFDVRDKILFHINQFLYLLTFEN